LYIGAETVLSYAKGQARGRKLLDKHYLHDWSISIENLRNAMYEQADGSGFWGYCDLATKTIRIDYRIGRRFRQVMLHEIAHALLKSGGHNRAWVEVASDVGCSFHEILLSAD
jgi:hypothetical protein